MAPNNYDAQASTNYKEAFSLFDKRGNGRVSLDNLGDLLRACGQNPTMTEIRDLEKNVGGDCEFCSHPIFVYTVCAKSNRDMSTSDDIAHLPTTSVARFMHDHSEREHVLI